MDAVQFIAILDGSGKFVRTYFAQPHAAPMAEHIEDVSAASDSMEVQSAFSDCWMSGEPQECFADNESGHQLRFRFEHVARTRLNSEDEVVVFCGRVSEL